MESRFLHQSGSRCVSERYAIACFQRRGRHFSLVEHYLDMVEVGGSNPPGPTTQSRINTFLSRDAKISSNSNVWNHFGITDDNVYLSYC